MAETDRSNVPWDVYHSEMVALRRDITASAEAYMSMLVEIRNSLGDIHTSLTNLPCDARNTTTAELAARVKALEANAIPWRAVAPVVGKKTIVTALCAVLGWLGAQPLADAITKWGK